MHYDVLCDEKRLRVRVADRSFAQLVYAVVGVYVLERVDFVVC